MRRDWIIMGLSAGRRNRGIWCHVKGMLLLKGGMNSTERLGGHRPVQMQTFNEGRVALGYLEGKEQSFVTRINWSFHRTVDFSFSNNLIQRVEIFQGTLVV